MASMYGDGDGSNQDANDGMNANHLLKESMREDKP